jgi:hypothetical protein
MAEGIHPGGSDSGGCAPFAVNNVHAFDTATECEEARREFRGQKAKPVQGGKHSTVTFDDALSFAHELARQDAECLDASLFGR